MVDIKEIIQAFHMSGVGEDWTDENPDMRICDVCGNLEVYVDYMSHSSMISNVCTTCPRCNA